MSIPLFLPSIKRKDMDIVLSTLVSDAVGPGLFHKQFIQQACEFTGMSTGLAFKEYRRTIEMALAALSLPENGNVVISPLAPQVYVDVLKEYGLNPVFADVEESTAAFSMESLSVLMEKGAAAIIVYHSQGIMPDMEKIREFNVPLIEDASQALGAFTEAGKAGSFGDCVIINLDPQNIVTAAGGALLLARGRKFISTVNEAISGYEQMYLLPDMNCALGFQQFHQIEHFIEKRRELAGLFEKAVLKNRHHQLHQLVEGEPSSFTCTIVINGSVSDVISYSTKKGVETDHAFQDAALRFAENADDDVPAARKLLLRCLQFPLYPMLSKDNTSQILKVLSTIP